MIVIRLSRFGRLKLPLYRIVAANKRSKREAKPLEVLGTWNPIKNKLDVKKDLLNAWLKKGAKLSAGVSKILKQ